MRCVHGIEWNFCWECRAKQAEKLLDELRHEMVPLAEAFYLRDVRGQIEVLHDQIAGLQEKHEPLEEAHKEWCAARAALFAKSTPEGWTRLASAEHALYALKGEAE
jgi:hypothetical protein